MAKFWHPCTCEGSYSYDKIEGDGLYVTEKVAGIQNSTTNGFYIRFNLPLPTTRGDGKKLNIDAIRTGFLENDSNNKPTMIKVLDITNAPNFSAVFTDMSPITNSFRESTFTQHDSSSANSVIVNYYCDVDTIGKLSFSGVYIRCEWKT